MDTGVFDGDRYFDVQVEYAKADVEDILIRITVTNRGPDAARIDLLPTIWFRNTWTWTPDAAKPRLARAPGGGVPAIALEDAELRPPLALLRRRRRRCSSPRTRRHCERCFDTPSAGAVRQGRLSPLRRRRRSGGGESGDGRDKGRRALHDRSRRRAPAPRLRLRLTDQAPSAGQARRRSARASRPCSTPGSARPTSSTRRSSRRRSRRTRAPSRARRSPACSGRSSSITTSSSSGSTAIRCSPPPPPERLTGRNADWTHVYNADVLAMPDTWEYPWYAAWDLAFHAVALAVVDADFAKDQLVLLLREWYMHPTASCRPTNGRSTT